MSAVKQQELFVELEPIENNGDLYDIQKMRREAVIGQHLNSTLHRIVDRLKNEKHTLHNRLEAKIERIQELELARDIRRNIALAQGFAAGLTLTLLLTYLVTSIP